MMKYQEPGVAALTTMRTIDFPKERLSDFRSAIPVGVEHYVIAGADRTYVNIRTVDEHMVDTLVAALQPAA